MLEEISKGIKEGAFPPEEVARINKVCIRQTVAVDQINAELKDLNKKLAKRKK